MTLFRLPNCIMIGFAVVIGEIIALGGLPSLTSGVLGFLSAFFLLAGTMVFNDIRDIDVDRVNNPSRPLPSGRITVREARFTTIILSALGLVASALLGVTTLLIALLALGLMIYYNTKGKNTGLLGNAVVSFNVALPFVFGGAAVNGLRPLLFIFSLLAFSANMAREIAKGVADVEGDRLGNIRTLAVSKGSRTAASTSALIFVGVVILSFLPPLLDRVSMSYYPGVILADIGFLYSAYRLIGDQKAETVRSVKTQVLVWMLLGLVGFLMGGSSLF